MKKIAHLVLADGTVIKGQSLFELDEVVTGEVVFSTSTTGYTEVLSDPSYVGQIVVMANPEIGNYGVNAADFQSDSIKVRALVVRNLSICASSFRAQMTLADWLMREQIPVLFGVDTRALISHIRDSGSMMAALSAKPSINVFDLKALAKSLEPMEGQRLSSLVSVKTPKKIACESRTLARNNAHVVVMDFGVKQSILQYLSDFGASLTLVPGDSSPEEIWAHKPDGLFLSNGPGDPKTETTAVMTIRALLGRLPIFGVCLGHQILAQALGYETYKLKFGHRGSNQAVKCDVRKIITTAQNHGFAVNTRSDDELDVITNISDGSNEGLERQDLQILSVQFHPEGAPGPHDALFYFEKFMTMMPKGKKTSLSSSYAVETLKPTLVDNY